VSRFAGDDGGAESARFAVEQERARAAAERERTRTEWANAGGGRDWRSRRDTRARQSGVDRNPPTEQQRRLAEAILRAGNPEDLLRRNRERREREAALREQAIQRALEEAARPRDPRTTAERLAGLDHHDPARAGDPRNWSGSGGTSVIEIDDPGTINV